MEVNLPFKIKTERSAEHFDIYSIGHDDFNGQLKHNVSAHPKINKRTGEFFAFGYSFDTPYVHYTLFNSKRKMINTMDIKINGIRMIHDFLITENFIIIPDMPLEFNVEKAMKEGGSVYKWNAEKPSTYAVMHKMNED